ncbi:phosphatidylinositol glycan anchor biosynthesis class W a [Haematobia irritans]|uniref:phosphatidylinositol glycan anchor biosynthesis class W a n=1 Tax=Haematobia irritans TaxID=7368 RepID=UPI003F4F435F
MNASNNANNTDTYCQSHHHYDYYCNAQAGEFECLSFSKQLLACRLQEDQSTLFENRCATGKEEHRMDIYEKHSKETITRIWHIQCTIIVTLIAISLARVVREKLSCRSWTKVFILEFVVISTPAIVSVNIVNRYVEYIFVIAFLLLGIIVWHSKCLLLANERQFEFGRRPIIFTLLRSTISLLTALCILAIDFESFPKKFRKSRRYGAGLMDVGIGLFVFSMALVSSRPKRFADMRKLLFTVGCVLGLGLARTIVITSIDYHQDEHEYGKHLNAFFTLGLTKLFATILGLLARSDKHLLPLGIDHEQQKQEPAAVLADYERIITKLQCRNSYLQMFSYEINSYGTIRLIGPIQCTIVVTLIAILLARVFRQTLLIAPICGKSWRHCVFLLEFIVISIPAILSVNIVNKHTPYIVAIATLILGIIIWQSNCLQRASCRLYEFGHRPSLFTLLRTHINLLTALCILAVDFKSFPRKFRKHRTYGAGLMDVGIGLFVFSMAIVSGRPKRLSDIRKMMFPVVCLLVLGLARTLVIAGIGYGQDEHEYGKHLNAFFTLGLTKLFGTLIGFLARKNKSLLLLGLVILAIHEITLQCGLSKYVMDPNLERTNFLSANREGLCSLPGFIALFILSQYFGQWIKSKDILSYEEIKEKLKQMSIVSIILWIIVVTSIMVIGIARVTCNFGYVTWMLAISITMCSLYLFVFDIVLDTILPVRSRENQLGMEVNRLEASMDSSLITKNPSIIVDSKIPIFIEAINYNGLLYFLLANVLTGMVNIFLNTDERTDTESVLILMAYMFVTGCVVSLLYRYKIRIA